MFNKLRKRFGMLLTAMLFAVSTAACGQGADTQELYSALTENETARTETAASAENMAETKTVTVSDDETDAALSITMLDVGQGLSILVKCDGEYMLFDGGDRDYSSYVVAYLERHGVDDLEYMVASHYDSDHIAGLIGVLNTTQVGTVLMPDYEGDTSTYDSFISMLEKNGAEKKYPEAGYEFGLGRATVEVIGPVDYDYEDENNNSIGVKISYGGYFSAVICGDMSEEAEQDVLDAGIDIDADLYVVNHHGSSSSSSRGFVEAVSPQVAFISCGAGNSYGHPTQKTLDTLLAENVQLFRSDLQGEVTVYVGGGDYWYSTSPTEDWSAGSNTGSTVDADTGESLAENGTDTEGTVYVLNTNSMKFHLESCEAVGKMNENNRKYTNEERAELIKQGYTACGICNP